MKCPLCKKYNLDNVKSGQWAMDDICGLCLDFSLKKEGVKSIEDFYKAYADDALLTIAGLNAIADKLCRRKVKQ